MSFADTGYELVRRTMEINFDAQVRLTEAVEAAGAAVVAAIAPYATGSYLNFAERAVDAAELYADDVRERLGAVRAEVDPSELMVANHQIAPAA